MTSDRNTQLDKGNYNEQVGRNVIHAENVTIVENLGTDLKDVSKEKPTTKKRLAFAIAGSIDQADEAKLEAIAALLREITGDASIRIVGKEKGSIRLILEGSEAGLEKLKELYESGDLTEVEGIPVEYVRFLETETLDDDPKLEADKKSRLIAEIRNQGAKGRNLRGADLSRAFLIGANLSDADLSRANLSDANLSRANLSDAFLSRANLSDAFLSRADLSRANLSDANLRVAFLIRADLSDANLRGADLSDAFLSYADLSDADLSDADLRGAFLIDANLRGANLRFANLRCANLSRANLSVANLRFADLRGADLSDADLRGADVENTRFGYNLGITKSQKKDLIKAGAIFEDASGDRSEVFSRV